MSRLLEAGHDERLICCLEGDEDDEDDDEGGKLRMSFVVFDEDVDKEGEVMVDGAAWAELGEAS